jgi:NAD(P)-dependent dehydrogenase (short-subunit alcohol dehydrogenase family)
MDLELSGKRAFVTGGSRGIGKQVARQLALEGASVAIAARNQNRLDATAAELAAESGQQVVATTVDTTDGDSVLRMGDAVVAMLGGIDILVNAAARPGGQGPPPPRFDEVTSELFFDEMNTKVLGYLRCTQVAAPPHDRARLGAHRQLERAGGTSDRLDRRFDAQDRRRRNDEEPRR